MPHPTTAPLTASYTIAFTLRSGSNLLCDYLALNGLGQPTEYFQYPLGQANRFWFDLLGVPPDDLRGFLEQLPRQRSQRGLFGSKMTWDHKNALLAALHEHGAQARDIADLFPHHRWIYLQRGSRIDQAVSLWRAQQSGVWTSTQAGASAAPPYDFFGLFTCLFTLLVEDHLWQEYFAQRAIVPHRISYEALLAEPRAVLAELAALLRPDEPLAPEQIQLGSPLRVQRDPATAQLRQRFREDLEHIGDAGHWSERSEQLQRWLTFFQHAGWQVEPQTLAQTY